MHQSESIAALAAALSKFQGEVEGAKKNATNPHLKNKYADLRAIVEVIREPLALNGLAVTQLPMPGEGNTLRLVTRLMHASGEWIESVIQMPLGKNDPQGYGGALTYARRYGLAALLGIVQEDDDGEGAMKRSGQSRGSARKDPAPAMASADQKSRIGVLTGELDWSADTAADWLDHEFNGKRSRQQLTGEEAAEAVEKLEVLVAERQPATT